MVRLATVFVAVAILVAYASTAVGAIGWCGGIWPNHGTPYTSIDDIDVYVQVWKGGCTDTSTTEPCPDVQAYLYYKCVGDADFTEVAMTYNVDVGNNDEFTGQIPASHGCDSVEFYVMVIDTADPDTCYGQDQALNDPNFILPITEVTAQDVTVRFHLCLSGATETTGDVCVSGSHPALTDWGNGVAMILSCASSSPKLYEVDVLFPAGSNPYVEYKYRKDGCVTWEGGGNHSFTIDDTNAFMDIPWVDGWEFVQPDCPDCQTAAENTEWSTIKALYR